MTIDSNKLKITIIPVPGNDWEPVRGDIRAIYDGEVCPYVEVSGQIARRFVGYETIKKDLEICHKIFVEIVNTEDRNPYIQNALWESFITKYGRCFVSSDGRGIKLERKNIFKGENAYLAEAHDSLIHKRHNFSAHAGNSEDDIVSGRLALLPPQKGRELVAFYIARDFALRSNEDQTKKYLILLDHVVKYVDNLLTPIYKKIKEEYASKDIDELYEQSKYIIV